MEDSFKTSIVKNFFWSFLGQSSYLIIGLIANIILARLLSPFEFGQVGIIMFFIIIAKVLTESGLSGALIRKKETSETDYSTIFIFNLVVSTVLMCILLALSGVIADFYNDPELKLILIASSSVLFINAFQITQNAKLIKDLKFKKKAKYEVIAIFFASIIGVVLAFNNAGVWAIVVMQIATAFFLSVLLWVFEGPLKTLVFNKKSFKSMYKFGVNTTLASLLNTVFDNVYQLILGRYFTITQTGFFYQGKKLQEIPVGIIKSTTLGVVFSTLSKEQENTEQFNLLYNKIVSLFTVIIGLICLLVFFYAENVILLLYGEKWIGALFYVQILIIASFFYLQEIFNRIIFKVFDKTEKILFLEIIKKVIQSITIIIGVVLRDIEVLLYGFLLISIISYLINYYVSRNIMCKNSWKEIILVFKVFSICCFLGYFVNVMKVFMTLEKYEDIYLLPLILVFYLFILHFFKVLNVRGVIQVILKTIKI